MCILERDIDTKKNSVLCLQCGDCGASVPVGPQGPETRMAEINCTIINPDERSTELPGGNS